MFSIVIKQLVDYIIIVCLMLSYIKLGDVVSRDLARSQWQQTHSLERVSPSSSWDHCKIMDSVVFQLQTQLLWVSVLVAVAGHLGPFFLLSGA